MLIAAGTASWEGGVKGWAGQALQIGLPMGSRVPGLGSLGILALFASWAGIECVSRLGDCLFAFGCCSLKKEKCASE